MSFFYRKIFHRIDDSKWSLFSILIYLKMFIVSAGKHLSNTNLSDLSIVGTRDIFVYR